jgi:hypothetical protein
MAEGEGYEVLITTDQSMPFQQNMTGRRISIVSVGDNRWPILQHHITDITAALENLGQGEVKEVPI